MQLLDLRWRRVARNEDRHPSADCDPYLVCTGLLEAVRAMGNFFILSNSRNKKRKKSQRVIYVIGLPNSNFFSKEAISAVLQKISPFWKCTRPSLEQRPRAFAEHPHMYSMKHDKYKNECWRENEA